jgi:hypothetical protein
MGLRKQNLIEKTLGCMQLLLALNLHWNKCTMEKLEFDQAAKY